MGTIFSALDIGRAGMFVAQVQLDVTAHNIANVNKEGFTRQRVDLTTRLPNTRYFGAIGRGPAVEGVVRLREAFLDAVYREQLPDFGSADVQAQYFNRIEDIFLEPTDTGFGNQLDVFFDALSDFSNNVEERPVRAALVSEAEALAAALNDVDARLELLRTQTNEEVRNRVPEINSITHRIAELNIQIRNMETGGRNANDLRDDRDLEIDNLSQIINVITREREDGQVDIILGGEELVIGDIVRDLEVVTDSSIDPDRPNLLTVVFSHNGTAAEISSGELHGALQIRDVHVVAATDRIDELARGLIESINLIHSQGRGLDRYTGSVQTTNPVISVFAPLQTAGELPFDLTDGSFDVQVYDATGTLVESVTIPIVTTGPNSAQTNLGDVEAAINGLANASALVDAQNLMSITPDAGFSITFANDTSGAMMALGLNSFFTGTGAASIALNEDLADNPGLISSGYSPEISETGDNRAALDMAAIRNMTVLSGGTQTLNEYYEALVVEIGVGARANLDNLEVERAFAQDFERRRQEVSGVSLDEEATNLIQLQRAFEGAARIITVADRMLETLVNLVR